MGFDLRKNIMITKTTILFFVLMVFINASHANDRNEIRDFNRGEIKSLMFKVTEWQNQHTEHIEKYRPLNWHLAAYYIGIMEMYKATNEKKYFQQMYELGKKYEWSTEEDIYDADRIAVGQMYLDVFKEKKEPEIIKRLKWVMDAHLKRKPQADVRFVDDNYRIEWWTWCDALFMAPPTFAKMYEATGEKKYLEYAIKHWVKTTDYLIDKEDKLIYRDNRYFDSRTPAGEKAYWSRGNGWVFAGLVSMLKIIPDDHPKRLVFETQFKEMAATLAKIQNEDGMWRPSLLDEKAFSIPETRGNAFFCYGMLWGIINGLLPKEEYETVAVKAWNGLESHINAEGRLGYVQPPGKDPKPFTEDSWHEYGTGAFLLAGSEMYRVLNKVNLPENSKKGKLIYENKLSTEKDIKGWKLEGPAWTEFKENWMHMYSPEEKGHHVLWCPEDFPANFIAEWELQNQETDAGLCILFFCAKGSNGKDIFDPSIKKRDGVFRKYTKSDINNYHISYYANAGGNSREVSHLRKNAGFNKVLVGEMGIPLESTNIHKMKLIKQNNRIMMYLDDRKIIDWIDDGKEYGAVLGDGKIGFRQMQWSHFRYRNFKVWEVKNK
ncbi:MAG: rhamnogalacturonyl hydrolase YesR [Saprospiraceae bacterium]|jgi:rhamnogalacturonyl hydrolase YesR